MLLSVNTKKLLRNSITAKLKKEEEEEEEILNLTVQLVFNQISIAIEA